MADINTGPTSHFEDGDYALDYLHAPCLTLIEVGISASSFM